MEDINTSKFHDVLPKMHIDEYRQLEQNIIEEGCREPLLVWNGILIDGHRRHRICKEHDISFETKDMDFKDENEAEMWIFKNQLGRRNIHEFTRAKLVLAIKDSIKAKAKENQKLSQGRGKKGRAKAPDLKPVNTRAELAKIANVSEKTISNVECIEKQGSGELKQQVESGQISISAAASQIRDAKEDTSKTPQTEEDKSTEQAIKEKYTAIGNSDSSSSQFDKNYRMIQKQNREEIKKLKQLKNVHLEEIKAINDNIEKLKLENKIIAHRMEEWTNTHRKYSV